MTQNKIKETCDLAYRVISMATEWLNDMRANCKHPVTHRGLYSWRIGSIEERTICSDCGEVLPNSTPNVAVSDITGSASTTDVDNQTPNPND